MNTHRMTCSANLGELGTCVLRADHASRFVFRQEQPHRSRPAPWDTPDTVPAMADVVDRVARNLRVVTIEIWPVQAAALDEPIMSADVGAYQIAVDVVAEAAERAVLRALHGCTTSGIYADTIGLVARAAGDRLHTSMLLYRHGNPGGLATEDVVQVVSGLQHARYEYVQQAVSAAPADRQTLGHHLRSYAQVALQVIAAYCEIRVRRGSPHGWESPDIGQYLVAVADLGTTAGIAG